MAHCCAGAGIGGVPHSFFYPEDKEDYAVLQFASAAAGSEGLAAYVQEAAQAAIQAGSPSLEATDLLPCARMHVLEVACMQRRRGAHSRWCCRAARFSRRCRR